MHQEKDLYASLTSTKFYQNDIKAIILEECISKHAAVLRTAITQVSESSQALWEKLYRKAGNHEKVAKSQDADMESMSTNSSPESFKVEIRYGETKDE
jgi:hypothetical protein